MEILLKNPETMLTWTQSGRTSTSMTFLECLHEKNGGFCVKMSLIASAIGCSRPPSIIYGGSVKSSILFLQLVAIIISLLLSRYHICSSLELYARLKAGTSARDPGPILGTKVYNLTCKYKHKNWTTHSLYDLLKRIKIFFMTLDPF